MLTLYFTRSHRVDSKKNKKIFSESVYALTFFLGFLCLNSKSRFFLMFNKKKFNFQKLYKSKLDLQTHKKNLFLKNEKYYILSWSKVCAKQGEVKFRIKRSKNKKITNSPQCLNILNGKLWEILWFFYSLIFWFWT